MHRRNWLALTILSVLSLPVSAADDWNKEKDQLTTSCSNLFGNIQQIGSCGEFLFSSGTPVRLTIPQSVVPGGGVALGATYIHLLDIPNWTDSNFTVQGGSSVREFWFGDAVLTLDHKKFIRPLSPGDRFQVKLYSHARGLPLMPFYGIGPNTSRSNITDFSEREVSIGASVLNPMSSWLDIGGSLEYFKPQVGGVSGVRSIDSYYSEATAPGLTHQPGFAHYQVSVQPKYDWHRTSFNSEVSFHKYQDLGTGHYSFYKFRTDFLQKIYPETQTEPTAGGTAKRRQPRYDSVLYIAGRISASTASQANVVPFYLQETIGGSDIDNIATLRGFQDYRFRAPDLFSLQVQYERRLLPAPPRGSPRSSTFRSVAGALGILAFYDAGEVATRLNDLSFSNVRHSFGFGLTFWSGEKVWFRAYIGLGSGEGSHTFVGITNPSAQNLHL
ncbi:MAG: hypothetical protein WB992_15505 [Bryobacteraceae bacterium]